MALLLTPREREAERQKSQEQLAREATVLGTKVDELRELEQSSKKRLQDFQEKSFAKFQEEEDERKKALHSLNEEIEEKRKELAKYFQPLAKQFALYVKDERGKIEAEKAKQAELSAELEVKSAQQQLKQAQQEEKELELKQQGLVIADRLASIEVKMQEADNTLLRAESEARQIVSATEKDRIQASDTLNKAQIVLREAELKCEAQDKREKELEDRELAVVLKELQFYSPIKEPLQIKK